MTTAYSPCCSCSAAIAGTRQEYEERTGDTNYLYWSRPRCACLDLPNSLDPRNVDIIKYRELLLRAVLEVLQPLGVTEAILKDWLFSRAGYLAPPGLLGSSDAIRLALPLLAGVQHLRLDAC